jgi:glycine/sarcosine N-methyltransferase
MYEALSEDYDRFVNWESRLAVELPFLTAQLQAAGARKVLDAACGTGQHALALARLGYEVVGVDASPGMIRRAIDNASAMGVSVRFDVAGFGDMATRVGKGFDAVLCLGNSLPHVLGAVDLRKVLRDFFHCLAPGGLLLVQNRNFDRVLAERNRWMDPQACREGAEAWAFLRFYDLLPRQRLRFHVVTLHRQGDGPWRQQVATTKLWAQRRGVVEKAVAAAGFVDVRVWGDMMGTAFDPESSPNLVLTARRVDSAVDGGPDPSSLSG